MGGRYKGVMGGVLGEAGGLTRGRAGWKLGTVPLFLIHPTPTSLHGYLHLVTISGRITHSAPLGHCADELNLYWFTRAVQVSGRLPLHSVSPHQPVTPTRAFLCLFMPES